MIDLAHLAPEFWMFKRKPEDTDTGIQVTKSRNKRERCTMVRLANQHWRKFEMSRKTYKRLHYPGRPNVVHNDYKTSHSNFRKNILFQWE